MGRVYEAREIFTSSEYGKGWLGGEFRAVEGLF